MTLKLLNVLVYLSAVVLAFFILALAWLLSSVGGVENVFIRECAINMGTDLLVGAIVFALVDVWLTRRRESEESVEKEKEEILNDMESFLSKIDDRKQLERKLKQMGKRDLSELLSGIMWERKQKVSPDGEASSKRPLHH